jgi:hypothetical protein
MLLRVLSPQAARQPATGIGHVGPRWDNPTIVVSRLTGPAELIEDSYRRENGAASPAHDRNRE